MELTRTDMASIEMTTDVGIVSLTQGCRHLWATRTSRSTQLTDTSPASIGEGNMEPTIIDAD